MVLEASATKTVFGEEMKPMHESIFNQHVQGSDVERYQYEVLH